MFGQINIKHGIINFEMFPCVFVLLKNHNSFNSLVFVVKLICENIFLALENLDSITELAGLANLGCIISQSYISDMRLSNSSASGQLAFGRLAL